MSDQYSLFDEPLAPPREHDLPLKWNGQAITWDEVWEEEKYIFICPPLKEPYQCDECGSTWKKLIKYGTYRTGTTMYRTQYNQIRKTPAMDRLRVERCVDCKTDTVWEGNTCWILGPEDYGDEGSYLIDTDSLPETHAETTYTPPKLIDSR